MILTDNYFVHWINLLITVCLIAYSTFWPNFDTKMFQHCKLIEVLLTFWFHSITRFVSFNFSMFIIMNNRSIKSIIIIYISICFPSCTYFWDLERLLDIAENNSISLWLALSNLIILFSVHKFKLLRLLLCHFRLLKKHHNEKQLKKRKPRI